jgi:hypothetical protein
MRPTSLLVALSAAVLASGCNLLGGESPEAVAARREADGKAIGGACRHAGRAIEDCYTLNKRADKSAVYAGWREMNDYMRENKLEPVAPQLGGDATMAQAAEAPPAEPKKPAARPSDKSPDKARAKDGAASAPHETARKRDS